MTTRSLGYMDGYLSKRAGWPDKALQAVGVGTKGAVDVGGAILPYALVLPILAGAGAGNVHSRVTSPSQLDAESVQKALEQAELEEFEADLMKRRERALKEDKEKKPSEERSLRI